MTGHESSFMCMNERGSFEFQIRFYFFEPHSDFFFSNAIVWDWIGFFLNNWLTGNKRASILLHRLINGDGKRPILRSLFIKSIDIWCFINPPKLCDLSFETADFIRLTLLFMSSILMVPVENSQTHIFI